VDKRKCFVEQDKLFIEDRETVSWKVGKLFNGERTERFITIVLKNLYQCPFLFFKKYNIYFFHNNIIMKINFVRYVVWARQRTTLKM